MGPVVSKPQKPTKVYVPKQQPPEESKQKAPAKKRQFQLESTEHLTEQLLNLLGHYNKLPVEEK